MYRLFSSSLVLVLSFLLVFAPLASNVEAAKSGTMTLSKTSGDVKVLRGKTTMGQPQAGLELAAGDEIVTGAESTADVRFPSNEVLRIMGNSRLKLNQGEPNQTSVGLSRGKIFNVITKYTDKVSTYKVVTPTATAGVRGTVFSAEVAEDDTSVIMVKEGNVGVASTTVTGEEVVVGDLTKTVVEKGKAPTAPIALIAAEIATFAIIADLVSAGAGAGGAAAASAGLSKGAIAAIVGAAAIGGGVVATSSGGGGGGGGGNDIPTTITGEWELHFKCADAASDAAVLNIKINETTGGSFTGSGNGTDYNGTPLQMTITGTYKNSTHFLSATVTTTFTGGDCVRTDAFSTTLKSNDTGYITMTQTQVCGCTGQVRMIKKQ